jgi:hypothetical protein
VEVKGFMKKIIVDDIRDKMVLARDVCGPSGNVLLGSGTPLTASLGRRLKNWGITFVHIKSDEEPAEHKNVPRVSSEDIENNLKEKFSRVMGNPAMNKIYVAVQSHFIQKGAEQA